MLAIDVEGLAAFQPQLLQIDALSCPAARRGLAMGGKNDIIKFEIKYSSTKTRSS